MTSLDGSIEWLPQNHDGHVRLGRFAHGLIADWPGFGRLVASGSEMTFTVASNVNEERLEKFRATELMACRRYIAGKVSLHGSAILLGSGAVVMVGESNAGKSTTAMALVEHAGAAFMADDIVPVDWAPDAAVSPVDDTIWLLNDARGWFHRGEGALTADKEGCSPRRRAKEPAALVAIVHLVFDDAAQSVEVERLAGQQAFLAISRAHVCFPWGGPDERLRDFDVRVNLAQTVPVLRVRRRRLLSLVDCVARRIVDACSASSHAQ